MIATPRHVDVYRVGLLYALHFDWRAMTAAGRRPAATVNEIRHLVRLARAGNWRTFRQQFDGWHAEHRYAGTRCGTGWTRSRALADLNRHLNQELL